MHDDCVEYREQVLGVPEQLCAAQEHPPSPLHEGDVVRDEQLVHVPVHPAAAYMLHMANINIDKINNFFILPH